MILSRLFFIIFFITCFCFAFSCRTKTDDFITIALSDKFSTLDTLTSSASDAAAERVRSLMFNSLVKKNEKFEYVGDLAKEIQTSADGRTITFILQDNVKFHNGKDLTSADVKYTFDELFKSPSAYKAGSFFETVAEQKVSHINSIETPDPKTVVFTIARPGLKNKLLSNLVAIPIISQGTVEQQKTLPIGTGAFKFVNFDPSQNTVELEANSDYWEGAPKVQKIRVKTVTDANSLQAELQSGGVDLAPLANNLPPDALNSLGQLPNLKVQKFNGSNIDYLGFNTQSTALDKVKIRQAIAFGVDREKIINELLSGQAVIAHSVLPPDSWAYNGETQYSFNPAKAKQLVAESGYKNEPIKFRFSVGNTAVNQYAQVIQNQLKEIGLNVEIETVEPNTLRQQLALGQFQMNTGRWIGGNQDPIFLNDLFATSAIPGGKVTCCNRSRYSNPEFDKIIAEALNSTDRENARQLYFRAQEIVANELPMLPLWYPANMVVSNKRIENIKINPSGDWTFIKDLTIEKR